MNARRIIKEEIDKYLYNNMISERKTKNNDDSEWRGKKYDTYKDKYDKNKKGIKHNARKIKNGLRRDFDQATDSRVNPTLTIGDEEQVSTKLDSDVVNVAAVARKLYPDLTPEGAQSKLRKKIKHEKSDSGSVYKLKKKEAVGARRILNKEI